MGVSVGDHSLEARVLGLLQAKVMLGARTLKSPPPERVRTAEARHPCSHRSVHFLIGFRYAPRESKIVAATRSGSSTQTACPASGISSNWLVGTRAAAALPLSTVAKTSFSPQMNVVGTRSWDHRSSSRRGGIRPSAVTMPSRYHRNER